MGPPHGVLPGVVALDLVLAETSDHVVAITRLSAYPTGLGFDLVVMARTYDGADPLLFGRHERGRRKAWDATGALDPDELRYGVLFSDGRKATSVGRRPPGPPDERGERTITLQARGGGGSDRSWHQEAWIWPLPPPGPLTFVCEWPAVGIAETRVAVDASVVTEAAARARVVWPGPPAG